MKTAIITLLMVTATATYAQCPTAASIVMTKKQKDNPYSISSQSGSASIKSGETYELSMIAAPGMDYRLSAKLANPSAGTITYEVYEMVVEKKVVDGKDVYKKNKHVLANSAVTTEPIEFATDKARKIFITVSMSGGDIKKPECVGVLIENKKSTKLGF